MNYCAVARTIITQLGGRHSLDLRGAKRIFALYKLDNRRKWPGLQFHLLFGRCGRVQIARAPDATYTIRFFDTDCKFVSEINGVSAEALQDVFRKYTKI